MMVARDWSSRFRRSCGPTVGAALLLSEGTEFKRALVESYGCEGGFTP
jgi:hypothetical protein